MAYFAQFTDRGQRALRAAQVEAAKLGRSYVGTEHLLLGVLTEPGAAVMVLKGIELDAVRAEVVQILGRGEEKIEGRQMVYTPRTKKVLEQSVREARELNQNYVSTEHILLALMREREGVAAHVMIKMGMDLNKARGRARNCCASFPATRPPPAARPASRRRRSSTSIRAI